MRVLFDNGTPRGVAVALKDHVVEEARAPWGGTCFETASLLDAAELAGFEVFVTTDRNLRFQQNLSTRKIAIVVLGKARWKLVRVRLAEIAVAVAAAAPGSFVEIDIPFSGPTTS